MKAIIYARVSSAMQRERHTIGSQLRELPLHVQREGWTLVDTLVDDGISGETVEARPSFLRVLELAESKSFDVLVVIDLDRITRAKKSAEGAMIYDTLREAKVRISVPGQALIDLDDEDQDFFVGLKREIAKWEKRKIVRRMMRGKREAVRLGKRYGCRDPYGLKWVHDEKLASGGSYQTNEEEKAVILQMVKMALAGDGAIMIAWKLREAGIKTRLGKEWGHGTVYKQLTTPILKGEFHILKGTEQGRFFSVPAAIDEETWALVQASIKGRRAVSKRTTKGEYLLQSVARCGVCGHNMWVVRTNAKSKNHREYYRCSTSNSWRRFFDMTGPCSNRHHRVDEVDAWVWSGIERLLSSPQLLADACAIVDDEASDGIDWRDETERLKRKAADNDALVGEVLARRRRGLISATACDAELETLATARQLIDRSLSVAQAQLVNSRSARERRLQLAEAAKHFRAKLVETTFEERKEFVRRIAKSVRLHADGSVEVMIRVQDEYDVSIVGTKAEVSKMIA